MKLEITKKALEEHLDCKIQDFKIEPLYDNKTCIGLTVKIIPKQAIKEITTMLDFNKMFHSRETVPINTQLNGIGYDEEYCKWYVCTKCNSSDVRYHDSYCSKCGCKFQWSGNYE